MSDVIAKYMNDLIYQYDSGEISSPAVCKGIMAITKKDEYYQDIAQNHIKDKIRRRSRLIKFGKSPEQIIIEWETEEVMLNFVTIISGCLTDYEWEIFRDYTLSNIPLRPFAKKKGLTLRQLKTILGRSRRAIRRAIPFYNEVYGGIREYLEDY